MTEGGELTDLDIALYRELLAHPESSLSQAAAALTTIV